jgi:hypothetical protein
LAIAIGTALVLTPPGAAPAAAPNPAPGAQSFKVTISPKYTTAGQPTTFHVTVANTSTQATTLGSVNLTSPTGFTPPHPTPGTPLRTKTTVRNRTLSLHRLSLNPGDTAQISITATAPDKCGRTRLHWSSQAFTGTTGSGPQLTLESDLSDTQVIVLCPSTALCGDGGPPCSTSLVTSNSTYAVISDAASGTLRQTVNVGGQLRCGAHRFRDPNWYDSVVNPAAGAPPSATVPPIVDQVTYKIRNATSKGIGFCLGAGYDFATASGGQAPASTLPNGNPGFIGLLPLCAGGKPPCISSISQQRDPSTKARHDVLMTIRIPESGDPWGRA